MKFVKIFIFSLISLSCRDNEPNAFKEEKDGHDQSTKTENSILTDLSSLEWLKGNWLDTTTYEKQKAHYIEKWKSTPDSIYATCSAIQNGDTNTVAYRAILMVDEKPVLIEHIPDQPLISYRFDTIFENGIRFENKAQNFPMQITYNRISNDSLVITLYGIAGQFERQGNLNFKAY